ncbi:hypothetical protein HDU85_000975 [Gaertneriomyces sp. JEL0708]|nr:hypothetical protein HDU85_000975 [Gaertneriomyces sp. JEL0708]
MADEYGHPISYPAYTYNSGSTASLFSASLTDLSTAGSYVAGNATTAAGNADSLPFVPNSNSSGLKKRKVTEGGKSDKK